MAVVGPILGIDVATRLGRVGLACGRLDGDNLHVDEVVAGQDLPGRRNGPSSEMVEVVADWLCARIPARGPVLLAFDAPLGWPQPLSRGLADHVAGARLPAPDAPDRLWRRATDVHIHQTVGKLPLEVGADRIARAAWAALELLHAIRTRTGRALPVPLVPSGTDGAIETYPAATLTAVLGPPGVYKGSDPAPRRALLQRLPMTLSPEATRAALAVDHAFDAAVCVLAGADFSSGRCPPVPALHQSHASTEGWIHVRRTP